ncbi:MAG: ABC transporter permease [Acholeplasmatales bacterium]|nr:ABC transporter permease [Acholeplasmatales bacterium]
MITLLISSIAIFAVFLYGSLGEIITEKSGHLNLGTPGIMCFGGIGGCTGVYLAYKMVGANNVMAYIWIILFAITFAILFGGLVGLLYSFLTVTLRSNQNITGLAITTFGVAAANYFGTKIDRTVLMNVSNKCFTRVFPVTDSSNDFLRLFFGHGFLIYLAIIIAILAYLFLKKTKTGLRLRAVGENPATADAAGINVTKYRYIATIVGGAIASFGGLTYIMVQMGGTFEQAVSIEGLGWISVALVIFSIWRPNVAILGSFVFAILYQLPYSSVISVSNAMKEVIKMLPYVVAIIVLIITSIFGGKSVQPPQALGTNYFREDR